MILQMPVIRRVSSRHRKHAAKHAKLVTPADVDRDAGMYVVKPQNQPEYFGTCNWIGWVRSAGVKGRNESLDCVTC